jgi:metal-responsive CopG/Arc/MetJ family transcriptional regulator
MRVVSIKIDDELLRAIDRYAEALGVSRSAFIKMAIKRFIAELREDERRGEINTKKLVKKFVEADLSQ